MRDVFMDIYNALQADDFIQSHVDVNGDVKFYEYPELGSIADTYIVFDEIDGALPIEYADNNPMAASELVQIDVYVKQKSGVNARVLCKELDNRIKKVVWEELKMHNTANSKPEYDTEYKLHRRASRFEGAFYYEEI